MLQGPSHRLGEQGRENRFLEPLPDARVSQAAGIDRATVAAGQNHWQDNKSLPFHKKGSVNAIQSPGIQAMNNLSPLVSVRWNHKCSSL